MHLYLFNQALFLQSLRVLVDNSNDLQYLFKMVATVLGKNKIKDFSQTLSTAVFSMVTQPLQHQVSK